MDRHQYQEYRVETLRVMRVRVQNRRGGGHFEFIKMPPGKFLHTLRKLCPEMCTNIFQSSKKLYTPLPP